MKVIGDTIALQVIKSAKMMQYPIDDDVCEFISIIFVIPPVVLLATDSIKAPKASNYRALMIPRQFSYYLHSACDLRISLGEFFFVDSERGEKKRVEVGIGSEPESQKNCVRSCATVEPSFR
jgi:hypothetical protein